MEDWTIIFIILGVVSAVIALISCLWSKKSAKAAERSAVIAQESWELERDLSRTSLRVEPIVNVVTHGGLCDAHIQVNVQNVGKEEGTLLKSDIVGIDLKTHLVALSMGSETQFPLAPGQTFNIKVNIKDIPVNAAPAQYAGHGVIFVAKYHGNYIKPQQTKVARLRYIWNGTDLSVMSDAKYKEIELFLPEDFKKVE
jgi:hypothetical protein